jgi:hypothetical protein
MPIAAFVSFALVQRVVLENDSHNGIAFDSAFMCASFRFLLDFHPRKYVNCDAQQYYLAVDVHFVLFTSAISFLAAKTFHFFAFYNEILFLAVCTAATSSEQRAERWKRMNNFHIIICAVYVLFVRMKANNMLPLIC